MNLNFRKGNLNIIKYFSTSITYTAFGIKENIRTLFCYIPL